MKKCKVCKSPFEPFNSLQIACGASCALQYVQKEKIKDAERKTKQAKKERLEFNRRHLPWQHEQCKTSFNRLRVQEEFLWFAERGLEPECISCGKKNMDWCCGHFKSVGAQSGLRYDRRNTFLQCNRYCNQALSANLDGNKNTRGYKRGLAERFGEHEAKDIIEHCESRTAPVKWYWQEMEDLRKEWNDQFRELQRQREAA